MTLNGFNFDRLDDNKDSFDLNYNCNLIKKQKKKEILVIYQVIKILKIDLRLKEIFYCIHV